MCQQRSICRESRTISNIILERHDSQTECTKAPPLSSKSITLGPVAPAMQGYLPLSKDVKAANPRCQRRDLTAAAATRSFTGERLYNVMLGKDSHSVGAFQDELQGANGTLRMHGAGHYSMGGDGSDVFTSLNDPAFYLHHAMVDRLYWTWQVLHPEGAGTINGTITFRNTPPSREGTLDDVLNLGRLAPGRPIRDMLDVLGGTPLCYIYM